MYEFPYHATTPTWFHCVPCIIEALIAGWRTNRWVQHAVRIARIMPSGDSVLDSRSVIATWMRVVTSHSWRFCFTDNRNFYLSGWKKMWRIVVGIKRIMPFETKQFLELFLSTGQEANTLVGSWSGFLYDWTSLTHSVSSLTKASIKLHLHKIIETVGFCFT